MPKQAPRTDTVLDADQDPDGVMGALGLEDSAEDEPDEQEVDDATDDGDDDDEQGDDEPTLAEVLAELAEQKRTIARLTREAAAARVASKGKPAPKVVPADDNGETETVEQAVERGKAEARLEAGLEVAGERIRASLTGIVPETDLDAFIDDLRLERYVGEDGKPDTDAIAALRDRQAKITRRRTPARVGHGRSGSGPAQKSKTDLMSETLNSLGL